MDFKSFCNTEVKNESAKKTYQSDNQKFNNISENEKEKAENLVDKYKGYSQQDLMQELLKITNEKKRNGTYNSEQMQNTYNTLSGMLPQEQRQMLDNIFKALK